MPQFICGHLSNLCHPYALNLTSKNVQNGISSTRKGLHGLQNGISSAKQALHGLQNRISSAKPHFARFGSYFPACREGVKPLAILPF